VGERSGPQFVLEQDKVTLRKTVVSIDNTVSTSIRMFQVPRGQTFMWAGSPVFAWKPVSVRTLIVWSNWAIRG